MKTSFILLIIFSSSIFASGFPEKWRRILESESSCAIDTSFWELETSPFAYLEKEGEEDKVPLVAEYRLEDECFEGFCTMARRTYYVSLQQWPAAFDNLPTYEVRMTNSVESSLPLLTVRYSGRIFTCSLQRVAGV